MVKEFELIEKFNSLNLMVSISLYYISCNMIVITNENFKKNLKKSNWWT